MKRMNRLFPLLLIAVMSGCRTPPRVHCVPPEPKVPVKVYSQIVRRPDPKPPPKPRPVPRAPIKIFQPHETELIKPHREPTVIIMR